MTTGQRKGSTVFRSILSEVRTKVNLFIRVNEKLYTMVARKDRLFSTSLTVSNAEWVKSIVNATITTGS